VRGGTTALCRVHRSRREDFSAAADARPRRLVARRQQDGFRFDPGKPAPLWELANPWTCPGATQETAEAKSTDIAYRTCYRACAGGPFRAPKSKVNLTGAPPTPIEVWDNDGIVNTLSMPWPRGENVLVHADHMDIVGQYKAVAAEPGGGRKYRAYDLLKSDSGFNDKIFKQVWEEVFEFCRGEVR